MMSNYILPPELYVDAKFSRSSEQIFLLEMDFSHLQTALIVSINLNEACTTLIMLGGWRGWARPRKGGAGMREQTSEYSKRARRKTERKKCMLDFIAVLFSLCNSSWLKLPRAFLTRVNCVTSTLTLPPLTELLHSVGHAFQRLMEEKKTKTQLFG